MTLRYALLVAAFLAAACGGDRNRPAVPPAQEPAAEPVPASVPASPERMVRGTVRLNPTMSFRPCDGGPIMSVVDSTRDRLVPSYSSMRATDDEGMFILARAANSPRNELILRELQFAIRPMPGEGCDQPAPDYAMLMRGTTPPWRITMTPAAIEFSDSTASEGVRFPAVAPDDSAGFTRYRATAESGGSHTLHLLLSQTPCNEAKSGAFAAMRAQLVVDGRVLSGCAWRGTVP